MTTTSLQLSSLNCGKSECKYLKKSLDTLYSDVFSYKFWRQIDLFFGGTKSAQVVERHRGAVIKNYIS